jgi:PAS domain S-box-containing protein
MRRARQRFSLSLRGWLVLLVLVSILPLLSFILGSEYLDYRNDVAATGRRTLEVARGMSQLIQEELKARIKILQTLAVSRALKAGDLDSFRAQAETVVAQQFPGANIVLLREDGQQVMNTLLPRGAPLPVRTNLESIKRVFATRLPAVSNLYQGAVVPRSVIAIDVPVEGPDGTVAYALSLNPNLSMFAEIINRQNLPASWLSGVVDRRGILVARVPGGDQFIGHTVAPVVFGHLTAEHEGIAESTSLEGIPTLTVFSHVEAFGWAVAIGVPRAELTGPALGAAMRTLAVGGILLSLSLALAVYVARRSLAMAVPLREPRRRLAATVAGWISLAMIIAIGLAVTVTAFMAANRAEEARVLKKLEFRVEWRARDLESKLVLGRRALWATATYAASRPEFDAARFLQFTSLAAVGSNSITAIAWAVPVTREKRAKFEAEAGFPIIEDGRDDKRIVAAEHADYTPFAVQNRFDGGPPSLGLDESREASRRRAIEAARDTGLPQTVLKPEASTIANPLDLSYWPIFDTGSVPATLVERRAHVRGYVVGSFRVVDLLKDAIAHTPDISETINFYVSNDTSEASDDGSFRLAATYSPTDRTVRAAQAPGSIPVSEYSFTRTFDQRGQRWRLVSSFSPAAVAAERSAGPIAILIAGLLMTILLAAYWVAGIRRVSVVRTLVDQRTTELRESNKQLKHAAHLAQVGSGVRNLVTGESEWSDEAYRIFGLSRETFVPSPEGFLRMVHPDDRRTVSATQEELQQGICAQPSDDFRIIRPDGTMRNIHRETELTHDQAGNLLTVVTIHDITERTRALEVLRESEERFRRVFEAVSSAIIMVGADGIIEMLNIQAEKIFGHPRAEILGRPIEVLLPERYRSHHPGLRNAFFAAPQARLMGIGRELYALRQDGQEFPVEVGLSPIETQAGAKVLVSVLDISTRHQAELMKAYYAAIFESSGDAIIAMDLDGVVTSWNKSAELIFGYPANEIAGKPIVRLLPPDRLDEETAILARVRRGERINHFETVRLREDGVEIPVSLTISPILGPGGEIIGASKIVRDITERNRMQANLLRSEDRFRSIFGAVSEGIFIVSPAGSFTEVNDAGCRMLGYTSDELIGGDIQMISSGVPPYTQRDAMEWHKKAIVTGRPQRFDWQCKTKAGRLFGAEVSIQFATISGQEVVLAMLRDVTDRQAIEAQLRQAQKMEAVGQLTGGLAHDFNNLLGIVLGNLDLLAEEFEPGDEAGKLADAAIEAAMRGAELTRQLLAFSRRQPLAPKVTYLPPVLEATGSLLRRTLGEAITFELKVSDTLWPVLIDVSQLESTLLNLSVNARDAMPQGGRVTIEAANVVVDESNHEHNMEATPGEYVLIAVSDTGAGMSPEVLAHVFEPFFTTKGSGGTGLGLSMVHGFLKQSGGYTGIYSEPGHGTTIRLYLPRAPEGEEVAKIETLANETLARGEELILVVEDNVGLREIAVRQLEDLGYRTIPAGDGTSALEIIQRGAPIDLLFTDVVMPGGLDGRALADAARRQRPHLKVLFTSGFTAAAASAATDEHFNSNLLSKPYRKGELAGRIRAALDT